MPAVDCDRALGGVRLGEEIARRREGAVDHAARYTVTDGTEKTGGLAGPREPVGDLAPGERIVAA